MSAPKKIGPMFLRACQFLQKSGPQSADLVGAYVWKGKKRGKTTSMGGGGDYGAMMLLGRMKAAGLVRHAFDEYAHIRTCTLWEVTERGRAEALK